MVKFCTKRFRLSHSTRFVIHSYYMSLFSHTGAQARHLHQETMEEDMNDAIENFEDIEDQNNDEEYDQYDDEDENEGEDSDEDSEDDRSQSDLDSLDERERDEDFMNCLLYTSPSPRDRG